MFFWGSPVYLQKAPLWKPWPWSRLLHLFRFKWPESFVATKRRTKTSYTKVDQRRGCVRLAIHSLLVFLLSSWIQRKGIFTVIHLAQIMSRKSYNKVTSETPLNGKPQVEVPDYPEGNPNRPSLIRKPNKNLAKPYKSPNTQLSQKQTKTTPPPSPNQHLQTSLLGHPTNLLKHLVPFRHKVHRSTTVHRDLYPWTTWLPPAKRVV